MHKSVCVKGRFCWQQLDFPGWNNVLPVDEDFVLTPYGDWTPPLLIGDGKRYLELHPLKCFSQQQFLSPCVWRENGKFFVGLGTSYFTEEISTLDDAITKMLILQGDHKPFIPDSIYIPGKGKLENYLNSPDSVLLILPFWHPANSSDANRNSLGKWYHFLHSRKVQKQFRYKLLSGLFHYKVNSIALRCGGFAVNDNQRADQYSLSDYRADGLCLILNKKTHSQVDIESFKADYIRLACEFGMKKIFCKEKNSFFTIHITNTDKTYKYENITGKSIQLLFDFLVDFYNTEDQNTTYTVPYIDEEIDRSSIPCCGSFAGAIAFYHSKYPVRRSQWYRIINKIT